MKKWMFLFVILGCAAKLHAAQTAVGNQYVIPSAWRSTGTASAISLSSITPCAVDFGGVIITSAGSGVGPASPQVGVYDGSNNLIISTINATAASPFPIGYGVKFASAGLRISNTGTTPATITILYNYRNTCNDGFRIW